VDLSKAPWHISTFSDSQGTCVEAAVTPDGTAVRHSKDPNGPTVIFNPDEWNAFLKGVEAGEFGRPR
jgi:hypothetical protein